MHNVSTFTVRAMMSMERTISAKKGPNAPSDVPLFTCDLAFIEVYCVPFIGELSVHDLFQIVEKSAHTVYLKVTFSRTMGQSIFRRRITISLIMKTKGMYSIYIATLLLSRIHLFELQDF